MSQTEDLKRARKQWRRLITQNGKATGHYETPVWRVSSATRLFAAHIVELVEADWWAFIAKAEGPVDDWVIQEDGE